MRGALKVVRTTVESLCIAALAVIVILPLVDFALARLFWSGLPHAQDLAQHALVVLTFLSAALASLDGKQLALSSAAGDSGGEGSGGGPAAAARRMLGRAGSGFALFASTFAEAGLFWASLSLAITGFDPAARVWILPANLFAAAMPIGFLLMLGFSIHRADRSLLSISCALLGLAAGSLVTASAARNILEALGAASWAGGSLLAGLEGLAVAVSSAAAFGAAPACILLVVSLAAGTPLFAVIGGVATLLFAAQGSYVELGPSEAYALLKGGGITAIPLFALVGFIMAESGAGGRFVAVLRSLFGWARGGEAVAAVLACALFTTFTGANGVTILALGGILASALSKSGAYSESSARGLIAASGAIGLLLPPSAAVIVYAIGAQFVYGDGGGLDIVGLFKGALLPGLGLVLAMCVAGVLAAKKGRAARRPFKLREAGAALRPALPELLVPVIAAALFFTGFAGLTEIGALCVLYVVVIELAARRERGLRGVLSAIRGSLPILGGTLVVLAAARGLSFYVIDADIPSIFTAWVTSKVSSPLVFLLALNLLLFAVGCLMDIYSAIFVVAPLVIPLGVAFGIEPVHFGVIFIMNLCIGFITPPVGMNLFLASYAFKKPMQTIVKEVLPYMLVQAAALLVVTYLPFALRLLR